MSKEIYYEDWLAHMIMDAEKPYNLPHVGWGPRKASSVFLAQTQRSENQGRQCVCPSLSEKSREPRVSTSEDKRR